MMIRKPAVVVMLAALASGTVFAQSPLSSARPAAVTLTNLNGSLLQRVIQALKLSDDQTQQTQTIFQTAHAQALPFMQQAQQNNQALVAAIEAAETAQIMALANTQAQIQAQILTVNALAMSKFYGLLTPEQCTALDQILQKISQLHAQSQSLFQN